MELLRKLLSKRANEFYLIAIILWAVPVVALVLFGIIYLWHAGWFWWFSGGLLVLSVASWVVRYAKTSPNKDIAADVDHLKPHPEWSRNDNEVWTKSVANIQEAKLVDTPWETLPAAVLNQVMFVARAYHGNTSDAEFAFSLPELLLMLETWSREYRAQVLENVPFIQEINVSTLMDVSRKADTLQQIYKYIGPLINLLKIVLNPATGVFGAARSQLIGTLFNEYNLHIQRNLKILLFEQVTQVAIDLYRGRFKLSEAELENYRRNQKAPKLDKVTPLSVMALGQINAGKSSLINALKDECVAEVDVLPATDRFHHYHMQLKSGLDLYFIDSPGLDGQARTSKDLLEEAVKADLLLWVNQANQPAKELDKQFFKSWNEYFAGHVRRKEPPILLITTYNDMLRPAAKWHPPYDLSDLDNEKVKSMLDALNYTHQSIGFAADTPMVPISLLPGEKRFNLDVLHDVLDSICDEARAAQLNRQRMDADDRASIVVRVLKQSRGLLKSAIKLTVKQR